jgi:hypothetical protein
VIEPIRPAEPECGQDLNLWAVADIALRLGVIGFPIDSERGRVITAARWTTTASLTAVIADDLLVVPGSQQSNDVVICRIVEPILTEITGYLERRFCLGAALSRVWRH